MKKLLLLVLTYSLSLVTFAGTVNCGSVTLDSVLTGPRHGAMIHVSNPSCGYSGWVCLDPNGEHMSLEESTKLFTMSLQAYMANKGVAVTIYDDKFTTACGPVIPVIEDLRFTY